MKLFLFAVSLVFILGCDSPSSQSRIDTAIKVGQLQGQVKCNQDELAIAARLAALVPEQTRQAHNSDILRQGLAIPEVKQCVREYRKTKGLARPEWCFKNAFAAMVAMDQNYQP